jgi:hypothetical protein
MSATTKSRRSLAFGLLFPAILVSVLATPGRGAPPAPKGCASDPNPDLPRLIMSAARCKDCHAVAPEANKAKGLQLICRMDEYLRWAENDKHKNAYQALLNDRSQLMFERLGYAAGVKDKNSRTCIRCHSIVDWENDPKAPGLERLIATADKGFDKASEGVTCVACHGASGDWMGLHGLPDVFKDWRGFTREQKAHDHGMVDLWDPITRLRKCASCHIGNAEEGKVLTHAMYAAGHPPLPGFELATFSDAMPYHWEYLAAKVKRTANAIARVQEIVREQQRGANKLEKTELVAVSGLVPLRETLALLVAEADAGRQEPNPGEPRTWPDYARFDCYACHHDVASKSWRQWRPFADAPGRPPAMSWPDALVALGVEAVAAKQGEDAAKVERRLDQYQDRLNQFHRALGARPFGDPDALKASANELMTWADGVLTELCNATFDNALAHKLLNRICMKSQEGFLDFDTARQLYWAFVVIHNEIGARPGSGEAISSILTLLDQRYHFGLPDAGKPEWIEKSLPARKEAVARFDPTEFQKRFAEIQRLLNPKGP